MLKTLILFLIVLMLAGCSTAPVQEMSDARQAITAAKLVGAHTSRPTLFSQARRNLHAAEIALGKGQYPLARVNAIRAKKQALRVRTLVEKSAIR